MSPLLTLRRFETVAHAVLPRPSDTAAMVAGSTIAIGTIVIGSPNGSAFNAAIIPGLIVATAIAARVGRKAAQRRRGENSFGASAIRLSRFLYLGCATLAAVMTVFFVMTSALPRLLEMLGG